MYQRITLTVARAINISPVTKIQAVLTPNWMGGLGWLSSIGFHASLIYIWVQWGFWWALGGFVFCHIFLSLVPIPQDYFFKIVIKHLADEMKRVEGNKEVKMGFLELLIKVNEVKEKYVVH